MSRARRAETPRPGEPLADAAALYRQLGEKFAPGRGHGPIWLWMPRGERVEAEWLLTHAQGALILCFDGVEARRTEAPAAVAFLQRQQPWEATRIYIVDDTYQWCFVSTDELLDEGGAEDYHFLRFVVPAPEPSA